MRLFLIWAALFATTSTALVDASVAATGSIRGTVTDEVTHVPVANVPVCAVIGRFSEGEERFCTQTDADGNYEVGDLFSADYAVEFLPGTVGMNYVYEAWADKHVWVSADDVSVAGAPVEGIDAELSEGGEIRGRVVDALSTEPVPGVEVCAESTTSIYIEEGCATTDGEGKYTIYGLAASDYAVESGPARTF